MWRFFNYYKEKVNYMKVVITIPAYNEEKSISKVIEDIRKTMRKTRWKYEIIVVDDGSTDKTAEVAKQAGATVFSHPYRYGLAEAFRTEMEKVMKRKPDIIIHIDADGQYKPEEIPKLIEPIFKNKADLVLGSRFLGFIEEMPTLKRFGNKLFSKTVSQICGVKITDSQTGFRAFTREFAEKVKIISRHTYTQEMIIKAIREKFRIKEVPVHFVKRKYGESKLISNSFEYGAKALTNIFRIYRDYEPLKFFGSIGASLFSIGVLIGLYILWIFFSFGLSEVYYHDLSIILMVFFLVSGLQVLLFGFLADKIK